MSETVLSLIAAAIFLGGLIVGFAFGISIGREVRDAELADKNHDRGGELW